MATDWETVVSILATGIGLAGVGTTRMKIHLQARSGRRSIDVLVELESQQDNDPATLYEGSRE
jgi:hypothetical protein